MSPTISTGSPADRRGSSNNSFSSRENPTGSDELSSESVTVSSLKKSVAALATSKLANQSYSKKLKLNHDSSFSSDSYPMDKLYAKLSEQQAAVQQQKEAQKLSAKDNPLLHTTLEPVSLASPLPITPAAEMMPTTAPTTRSASLAPGGSSSGSTDELLRLKLELAQAQNKISRLDQELAHTRIKESGRVTPFDSEVDFPPPMKMKATVSPVAPRMMTVAGPALNLPIKPTFSREQAWMMQEDAKSDAEDNLSAGGLNRGRGLWNATKPVYGNPFPQLPSSVADEFRAASWANNRTVSQPVYDGAFGQNTDGFRVDRLPMDHDIIRPVGRRGNRYDNRFVSANFGTAYNAGLSQFDASPAYSGGPSNMSSGMGMSMYPPFQPGVPSLSPHATEFTSGGIPWKTETITPEGQTFLPATEPLNYRRLLDRNVTCDWKYIVDKIVCNNDQQASIFLQQKLKVGTPEQKYDIVEAIVAQAYPLMVNRFGNFLVQRCFEHGTPEQVIKIADAIRGNTLNLSMDPFGCHVVQKAFDSVPEDYKAIMVHELLRRIPETVIHRYACHVWQKLFELRWTESPPQIMKYVNDALRGMWHEVALGETGSLVVQNIFENCLEEDKRPCIEEVLANIDIVAHGQFGNWCIQHICEHGAPADRSRAIDHVIRFAAEYSMDQFASKVVEKCLKISGPEFLTRYLDRVCEGRVDRPRIPLIDIASDQYGNYLIQYILTHASPQHREIVAAHIRKHMVSLRGSKFGSRVGMLCTNHAVATRPGPGAGPAMSTRMGPGPRYGATYR
ncbi:meiotic coiled-coil protein 2 [Echria macrotheca]|uniref:Meiotic coiled-coil protein 2 n=1 Tax=Echria macrotheca TaxID=438768 RepID=A0AAJ0BQA2_9PEZI|nr:meiotic coiled-coil protein 2 [Echria macrotheca]